MENEQIKRYRELSQMDQVNLTPGSFSTSDIHLRLDPSEMTPTDPDYVDARDQALKIASTGDDESL